MDRSIGYKKRDFLSAITKLIAIMEKKYDGLRINEANCCGGVVKNYQLRAYQRQRNMAIWPCFADDRVGNGLRADSAVRH